VFRRKIRYNLGEKYRKGKESKMALGLSPTSRLVLDLLREDSRRTATEIAHQLGVSRTTIAYHIARLTKDGTIRRFTIDVDPAATALPQGVRAMFDVVLSRGS
jgi:Lrp/AsnC family leucine-responsive transcriptional regulator